MLYCMDLAIAEENIIHDFSVGQESAFRILYDKYASGLRLFASKYVDDDEVIGDVVQDVFVRLWEKRGDFCTEVSLKSFLYKSIKNSCPNIIRHQGVKERYAEVALREEEYESFLDNVIESEVFTLLMSVFDELPPVCKEVYRLSLDGKKHEEIAESLNITVNTVKKHKNNANHYMRGRLKNILCLLLALQVH